MDCTYISLYNGLSFTHKWQQLACKEPACSSGEIWGSEPKDSSTCGQEGQGFEPLTIGSLDNLLNPLSYSLPDLILILNWFFSFAPNICFETRRNRRSGRLYQICTRTIRFFNWLGGCESYSILPLMNSDQTQKKTFQSDSLL